MAEIFLSDIQLWLAVNEFLAIVHGRYSFGKLHERYLLVKLLFKQNFPENSR